MMRRTYIIDGMTCGSCEAKVKDRLMSVKGIIDVEPSKEEEAVTIVMERQVPFDELQAALGGDRSRYRLER